MDFSFAAYNKLCAFLCGRKQELYKQGQCLLPSGGTLFRQFNNKRDLLSVNFRRTNCCLKRFAKQFVQNFVSPWRHKNVCSNVSDIIRTLPLMPWEKKHFKKRERKKKSSADFHISEKILQNFLLLWIVLESNQATKSFLRKTFG